MITNLYTLTPQSQYNLLYMCNKVWCVLLMSSTHVYFIYTHSQMILLKKKETTNTRERRKIEQEEKKTKRMISVLELRL